MGQIILADNGRGLGWYICHIKFITIYHIVIVRERMTAGWLSLVTLL